MPAASLMPANTYKPSLRRLLAGGDRFLTVAEIIAARGWTSAWGNTFLGRDHHGRAKGES